MRISPRLDRRARWSWTLSGRPSRSSTSIPFVTRGPSRIRSSWPALAGARPETIVAPAHYLKQFHADYADPDVLQAQAEEEGRRNWAAVHIARFRPYKNVNPDLPTLQPWVNTTAAPSQRYVFVRNPYFHRVDENGLQLPYIDRVVMNIADGKLIPAKAGAGEADLQARHLAFSDYTFLKQNEQRSKYRVLLWDTTKGAHVALYPNLNVEDPGWRGLVRDARFRHALSLAIDRSEINQVLYYGLAAEGNDTVFPLWPPVQASVPEPVGAIRSAKGQWTA